MIVNLKHYTFALLLPLSLVNVKASPIGVPDFSQSGNGNGTVLHIQERGWGIGNSVGNRLSNRRMSLLGFRYVAPKKALEYNKVGTLTAIPASLTSIGEGAYLSPALNEFPDELPSEFWECTVGAITEPLKKTPKLFVSGWRGADWEDPVALKDYINLYLPKKSSKQDEILLFSHSIARPTFQALIPPRYLAKSPTFKEQPHGRNRLGIKVWCVEQGCTGRAPNAHWESWGIPHWRDILVPRGDPGAGNQTVGGVEIRMEPEPESSVNPSDRCSNSPPQPEWVKELFDRILAEGNTL